MNIVFYSLQRGALWGGSENLWFKTAIAALEQKNNVLVILYEEISSNENISLLKEKGAEIFLINNYLKTWSGKIYNRINKNHATRKFSTILRNRINQFGGSLIVVNQAGCFDIQFDSIVKTFLQTTSIPYVICSHSYLSEDILNKSEKDMLSHLFEKAEVCYFVSSLQAKTILQQVPSQLKKIDFLGNPINQTIGYTEYPSDLTAIKFATIGSLNVKWKGQDVLIEILSQENWIKQNWQLNIYGDGPDFEYINKIIQDKGLESKIFLRGYEKNQQKIWQENHILLMPSLVDAAPSVLLETMACGRTIVANDIGFVYEWITSEDIGFVSESAEKNAFNKILNKAWNLRHNWETMGKNCKLIIDERLILNPELKFLDKILGIL